MGKLLARWIILAISLVIAQWLTSLLMKGFTIDTTPGGVVKLLIGVAVLALFNATLGKLLKFLTIPLNCLTLGLFSLVINAAMLYLAGTLELGFKVTGFWPALVGSILLSAVNGVLGTFVSDDKDSD